MTREFVVVTNNYRADGGGGFPGLGGDAAILRAPDANRDALLRYFEQQRDVAVPSTPSWRFAKQPEPIVLRFETAPAAKALLTGLPALTWDGAGEDGWDRLLPTV